MDVGLAGKCGGVFGGLYFYGGEGVFFSCVFEVPASCIISLLPSIPLV